MLGCVSSATRPDAGTMDGAPLDTERCWNVGTARLRRVLKSACCFGKPHPNRMAHHHPDGQQALRGAIRQAMRNR
jgi:hypothetical protein